MDTNGQGDAAGGVIKRVALLRVSPSAVSVLVGAWAQGSGALNARIPASHCICFPLAVSES